MKKKENGKQKLVNFLIVIILNAADGLFVSFLTIGF
jgi:hypothetical protein